MTAMVDLSYERVGAGEVYSAQIIDGTAKKEKKMAGVFSRKRREKKHFLS